MNVSDSLENVLRTANVHSHDLNGVHVFFAEPRCREMDAMRRSFFGKDAANECGIADIAAVSPGSCNTMTAECAVLDAMATKKPHHMLPDESRTPGDKDIHAVPVIDLVRV